MKTYIIYWTSGGTETVQGATLSEALADAGFSLEVMGAIERWEEVKDENKKTAP